MGRSLRNLHDNMELRKCQHMQFAAPSVTTQSLSLPCHRVVGTDGSLTSYAGGIDKKIQLLTLEKADMTKLYPPKKGPAL